MGHKHKHKAGSTRRREANGRLSRRTEDVQARQVESIQQLDQIERETILPGIAARIRVHGVKPEDTRDQFAGSFVGRLFLSGEITRPQLEAATTYFEECHNHSIACGSPRQPGAVDLNATRGSVNGENEAFAQRSLQRYRDTKRVLQEAQNALGMTAVLFAALSICVLQDKPAMNLVGDLRSALNCLVRHYKLGAPVKAKAAALETAA